MNRRLFLTSGLLSAISFKVFPSTRRKPTSLTGIADLSSKNGSQKVDLTSRSELVLPRNPKPVSSIVEVKYSKKNLKHSKVKSNGRNILGQKKDFLLKDLVSAKSNSCVLQFLGNDIGWVVLV